MSEAKETVESRILSGLRQFAEDLEAGRPVEVTRVRRVETPDGPMHLHTKARVRLDRPQAGEEE